MLESLRTFGREVMPAFQEYEEHADAPLRHPRRRRRSPPTSPTCRRSPGPTWELPDAEFLQINWEVDDEAALDADPAVAAPVDPAVRLVLRRAASRSRRSGPFSIVQVRLVVRAGIRPARPVPRRGLRLGRRRSQALRDHWGYPVQLGEVDVAHRHDQVRFTAALDGRTVVDLAVHTADVINGSDLMTFDNLHLVRLAGRGLAAARAGRSRSTRSTRPTAAGPTVSLPDPQALGMRGALRLVSPIIGFTFRADSDLVPVRFTIDSVKPAIASTKRVSVADGGRRSLVRLLRRSRRAPHPAGASRWSRRRAGSAVPTA